MDLIHIVDDCKGNKWVLLYNYEIIYKIYRHVYLDKNIKNLFRLAFTSNFYL